MTNARNKTKESRQPQPHQDVLQINKPPGTDRPLKRDQYWDAETNVPYKLKTNKTLQLTQNKREQGGRETLFSAFRIKLQIVFLIRW